MMKFVLLASLLVFTATAAKVCLQNPKFQCGDKESCVLAGQGKLMCCPFEGSACANGNTCCPSYAPTCLPDGKTCGVGRLDVFNLKIQSELKESQERKPEETDSEFFKILNIESERQSDVEFGQLTSLTQTEVITKSAVKMIASFCLFALLALFM
eukprot:TRINITY_DN167_c0_g1_i11.p1 TRINITY_DN167_c0_g1~~TRINITY_DN167_c0_g1_i11.p1  ORF type:complete len:155 (-),score=34.19 TRINITY_DN167_c0_g1_i11:89-553(-)